MTMRRSLAERLWEKVDKNGPTQPHMTTPCWVWRGAVTKNKYGSIGSGGRRGKVLYAHVVAFTLQHGPVPDGQMVLHHCDYKLCMRHVYAGTHAQNMLDRQERGRTAKGEAHGWKKHPELIPRGSARGNAKLTEVLVRAMRKEAEQGATQAFLADKYNISSGYVCRIIHGEVWTHAC